MATRRSSSTTTTKTTSDAPEPASADFVDRPDGDALDPEADDRHHGYEETKPPDGYVRPEPDRKPPAEEEG